MTATPPADGLVEIRLLSLPLDAYREASEHGDELRREFALIAAREATGARSLPVRLVALIEALEVQFQGFTAAPNEALGAALERGDEYVDVVYRLPAGIKEAALELGDLLDEADEFCRRGDHLLTLTTPPNALAFRRWFLSEFVAQADGAQPTSWEDWAREQIPAAGP
jgi:hypothetical protein